MKLNRRIMDDADLRSQMIAETLTDENLELLREEISNVYGFECPPLMVREGRNDNFYIESEPLDISGEPILSAFIKEIQLDSRVVWADPDEGLTGMILCVSYNHYDGSNGHDIGNAAYDIQNGFWVIEKDEERYRYTSWKDRLR